MTRVFRQCAAVVASVLVGWSAASAQGVVVAPVLGTTPLNSYEDAPASPDADDPAIWVNRLNPRASLVIGTAKDAGLLVYDLDGRLLQAIRPPNAPHVGLLDPPTPAGPNPAPDRPCQDSETGQTYGRFNNVDVAYDVRLRGRRVDIAVVSDRGCDRVRFYLIDPASSAGPLVDITAIDVPRVFPSRYDQPSPLQPTGTVGGWHLNQLDDQNTVYGLAVAARGYDHELFVTERERGLVRQLEIEATRDGRLTYRVKRTFVFRTSFVLKDERNQPYAWTPCREAAVEEPQSEGVLYDPSNDTLYVAFETIGLYKVPLNDAAPAVVGVGQERLIEPVLSFGRAYRATPDDGEFSCEYEAVGSPGLDDVVAPGSPANAGAFLQTDLEGLSLVASIRGQTVLLASSQGDSSFHFYRLGARQVEHLGAFTVAGVGETDGVHFVPVPLGRRYPAGLLVVQNGAAPEPADTGDINGYEFDGATQFTFVSFLDALKSLRR